MVRHGNRLSREVLVFPLLNTPYVTNLWQLVVTAHSLGQNGMDYLIFWGHFSLHDDSLFYWTHCLFWIPSLRCFSPVHCRGKHSAWQHWLLCCVSGGNFSSVSFWAPEVNYSLSLIWNHYLVYNLQSELCLCVPVGEQNCQTWWWLKGLHLLPMVAHWTELYTYQSWIYFSVLLGLNIFSLLIISSSLPIIHRVWRYSPIVSINCERTEKVSGGLGIWEVSLQLEIHWPLCFVPVLQHTTW